MTIPADWMAFAAGVGVGVLLTNILMLTFHFLLNR